jgi:hypothetical protein
VSVDDSLEIAFQVAPISNATLAADEVDDAAHAIDRASRRYWSSYWIDLLGLPDQVWHGTAGEPAPAVAKFQVKRHQQHIELIANGIVDIQQ